MSEPGKIYAAIAQLMGRVDAISKGKKSIQGYKYRGVEDVMNALHPILADLKIFPVATVVDRSHDVITTEKGKPMSVSRILMRYTFFAEDGSSVATEALGEAFDSGDKASNKAMSVAYKYAMFQLLCIPTEAVDPDADAPQLPANAGQQAPPPDRKSGVVLDSNHENGDGYSARLKGPANSDQLKEIMALAVDLYGSKEAAGEKLQAILTAKGLAKPADLTYGDADGLLIVLKKKLSERDLPFDQTSQPAQQT